MSVEDDRDETYESEAERDRREATARAAAQSARPLDWRDLAIWHVPLLVVAGLTSLAGVLAGILVWRGVLPDPWGPAVHWACAGASITFVLTRVFSTSRFTRREAEILGLVAASFVFGYVAIIAGAMAVIMVVALVLEEVF